MKKTFDYIVIGAGSSGAVLASRLSENPNNNVLLIEAGDSFEKIQEIPDVIKNGMATGADWTGNLAVGTDYDWKYEGVSNEDFKNMGVPRGKVIGGTSSINGQVFIRAIPEDFQIYQNYPNPFNPSTTIKFGLPIEEKVTLKVYDVTGREIATLINENLNIGYHKVVWNGINDNGMPVSSGIYLYSIKAGEYIFSQKMLLVK